jgi:hypothetical protein
MGVALQLSTKKLSAAYVELYVVLRVKATCFYERFLPRLMSQMISITMMATMKMPVHIPALKMPPMASQLLKKMARIRRVDSGCNFFISEYLCVY